MATEPRHNKHFADISIPVRDLHISAQTPQVMGILNATPDSFYAGSRMQTEADIANRALQIVAEGGSIIDIGAFSTRPGGVQVTEEEEMRRMRMAMKIVRRELPQSVVSVDTFRPSVARMCVEEYGADIVNDVSEGGITGVEGIALEGTDASRENGIPAMFSMMARLRVPYILMSVKPDLPTMQEAFHKETALLGSLGVKDIILDPGFGFGKDVIAGNYSILRDMHQLHDHGFPILVGVSRKRMVWQLTGGTPDTALNGTTAVNMLALERGAAILRVHDVREAVECTKIASATFEN